LSISVSSFLKLFRYLLRLRRYKRKSVEVAVFRRGGSIWEQISEGNGRRWPTTVGVNKLEWLPFCAVLGYLRCIVWFCHKARVSRMNRQTDRQTELRLKDRASIAAPCGKNRQLQSRCISATTHESSTDSLV